MNSPYTRRLVVSWISVHASMALSHAGFGQQTGHRHARILPAAHGRAFLASQRRASRNPRGLNEPIDSLEGNRRRFAVVSLRNQKQRAKRHDNELHGRFCHASSSPGQRSSQFGASQRSIHPTHRRHVDLRVRSCDRVVHSLRSFVPRSAALLRRFREGSPGKGASHVLGIAQKRGHRLPCFILAQKERRNRGTDASHRGGVHGSLEESQRSVLVVLGSRERSAGNPRQGHDHRSRASERAYRDVEERKRRRDRLRSPRSREIRAIQPRTNDVHSPYFESRVGSLFRS